MDSISSFLNELPVVACSLLQKTNNKHCSLGRPFLGSYPRQKAEEIIFLVVDDVSWVPLFPLLRVA